MKPGIEKIKNFIIKHHILIALIGAPIAGILGFTGMVVYNQTNYFCLKCHYNEGTYIAIDFRTPEHQGIRDGEAGCMSCHPNKALEKIIFKSIRTSKNFTQRAANLSTQTLIDPRDIYSTEQCLECHPRRIDVMERDTYLLPTDRLQSLGLMLNKRLHHRFEAFGETDQQRYQELLSRDSPTSEETGELQLLEKIRIGNCGQCHMQKKQIEGDVMFDKGVNFIARNPMSCAGCHEEAGTLSHPGKPMHFPSKEICQKCHHGKIHGKFAIFKADCDEQKQIEHCIKCHPYYKTELVLISDE